MAEGDVEQGWYVDTTEDIEVGEITLGDNNETDEATSNWSIESFAITKQFQDCSGKVVLQERYDAVVEDHEDSEEYENTPDNVHIIS